MTQTNEKSHTSSIHTFSTKNIYFVNCDIVFVDFLGHVGKSRHNEHKYCEDTDVINIHIFFNVFHFDYHYIIIFIK